MIGVKPVKQDQAIFFFKYLDYRITNYRFFSYEVKQVTGGGGRLGEVSYGTVKAVCL